ncbi:predicted protein [Nematostella vectensis]|uniref:RING-type domain-containing protein n=1 Tax=Nematostella vectensis TaxID=45351 RepID=A7RZU5_NEMVE|nr:predicted protein [Nematostella vectensis]|eukprot:XP_001635116.1 predicted protein [Nematostella vectensis]
MKLLKGKRAQRFSSLPVFPNLQKEVDFISSYKKSKVTEVDRKLAVEINEKQYVEQGQTIECGCCYCDVAFEDMVQCLDGHLFCENCLMNYAKESVFGQGKATLMCMTSECNSSFPLSQLKKTLPENILSKYEDRLQEEALSLAEMEDLVRCPSCEFAAVLPSGNKVFKCLNQKCGKETCRHCKENWSDHFGLKCSEIEKKGEKDLRISYEERMTMAKIRKCHKCGCEFTKSDGCNKMTCRCGTTQCYVCRKPGISYNHFCQHARDPGKGCSQCKNCSLWTDPSKDDNMAVKQLERKAKAAKRQMLDQDNVPGKKPKL